MQESVIYRSIQKEAETRAEARKQREIANNLLRNGVSVEVVALGTGLSVEEVQQLQQQINESAQG
jgi:predicted transposase YdaD